MFLGLDILSPEKKFFHLLLEWRHSNLRSGNGNLTASLTKFRLTVTTPCPEVLGLLCVSEHLRNQSRSHLLCGWFRIQCFGVSQVVCLLQFGLYLQNAAVVTFSHFRGFKPFKNSVTVFLLDYQVGVLGVHSTVFIWNICF